MKNGYKIEKLKVEPFMAKSRKAGIEKIKDF